VVQEVEAEGIRRRGDKGDQWWPSASQSARSAEARVKRTMGRTATALERLHKKHRGLGPPRRASLAIRRDQHPIDRESRLEGLLVDRRGLREGRWGHRGSLDLEKPDTAIVPTSCATVSPEAAVSP
jgi:hypothetical protein